MKGLRKVWIITEEKYTRDWGAKPEPGFKAILIKEAIFDVKNLQPIMKKGVKGLVGFIYEKPVEFKTKGVAILSDGKANIIAYGFPKKTTKAVLKKIFGIKLQGGFSK